MKQRAKRHLHEAACIASRCHSRDLPEIQRLTDMADALQERCKERQSDMERAAWRPANRHTAAASGAGPGETIHAFPRALRRTLLELGMDAKDVDRMLVGRTLDTGARTRATKGKGEGGKGKGKGRKGKGKDK